MDGVNLTTFLLQRGLALIYLMGFLNAYNQFRPLCGVKGLTPITTILAFSSFKQRPSLFWWNHSDRFTGAVALFGVVLSLFALSGASDLINFPISVLTWALLWILYMSFVNMGQTFYSFGWESMTLEAGFLAIFLGPATVDTPWMLFWLYRWMAFRVMFGAGLIKLRADSCWKDLTALCYHYETQPIPNRLSRYFHFLPVWFHKVSCLVTHFVELIVPFGLLIPGTIGQVAALLTILFQVTLILSGNLSWLNYLTIVLCIPCFEFSHALAGNELHYWIALALAVLIIVLSYRPTLNLFSPRQSMNRSYDSLHLVNTYGAFGSVTKERFEVVLEGKGEDGVWREYEFKGKPGDPSYIPRFWAPYHLRLDWLMWFAAMGVHQQYPWIMRLAKRLLDADPNILKLIRIDPFDGQKPLAIRGRLYQYWMSKESYWERELAGEYFYEIEHQSAP